MKISGNNLIAANILATYIRFFISAGLGLFSTRWILQSLGEKDFGLFSVVGGLIVFILFIGSTISSSVQRFFAYAIGQGDPERVKLWFNTAFCSLLIFSIVLVAIGVPLGQYLIKEIMNIPISRLNVCLWVYFFSILGAVEVLMSVPYLGMFIAKQRIFELSFWGLFQSVCSFSFALYLLQASGDLLFFYAIGMVVIKMVLDFLQIYRAMILFPECKLQWNDWFNKDKFKELFSFVGWDLFGGLGFMVRNSGTAFLINIFSGPAANAAYGIANQVAGQTNAISAALTGAMSPEITAREGAGNRNKMLTLSLRSSKFAVILTYLWLFPLYSEMNYVLGLWLKDVPEYATIFCKIILLIYAISNFTIGSGSAIMAQGKIKLYQLFQGGLLCLTFPLMLCVYEFGASPVQALLVMLVTGVLHSVGRVFWAKRLLSQPYSLWIQEVLVKCLYPVIPSLLVALVITHCVPDSFFRLILISFCTAVSTLIMTWYFSFDTGEKSYLKFKYLSLLKKFDVVLFSHF